MINNNRKGGSTTLTSLGVQNVIPDVDGGGVIGTESNQWASGYIKELIVETINDIILTVTGDIFKVSGGTKELTVDETTTLSSKSPKGFSWFMGE